MCVCVRARACVCVFHTSFYIPRPYVLRRIFKYLNIFFFTLSYCSCLCRLNEVNFISTTYWKCFFDILTKDLNRENLSILANTMFHALMGRFQLVSKLELSLFSGFPFNWMGRWWNLKIRVIPIFILRENLDQMTL